MKNVVQNKIPVPVPELIEAHQYQFIHFPVECSKIRVALPQHFDLLVHFVTFRVGYFKTGARVDWVLLNGCFHLVHKARYHIP